jgi:C_GCAxxG_C_C family probable redox protein
MDSAERIDKAVALFKQGYNCAQSVTAAFADLYGMTPKQALLISASFGAGIGRMREVCGAASGMFILAGLQCGSATPGDAEGKKLNYEVVRMLAAKFRERNGSMICGELLGLRPMQNPIVNNTPLTDSEAASLASTNPVPEARTEEYYKKRPCVKMVEEGARIFAEYLDSLK